MEAGDEEPEQVIAELKRGCRIVCGFFLFLLIGHELLRKKIHSQGINSQVP